MKISDYEEKIVGKRCFSCGSPLVPEIEMYPHEGGWEVELTNFDGSYKTRMWLYVRCRVCGYENALWKLGIPRDNEV